MSKYYSFNDFMNEVIDCADSISRSRIGKSLEDLYEVKAVTYAAVKKLISNSWGVFLAVVALLLLGPVALTLALGTFMVTPPGLIVVTILGVGAVATIHQMYRDRVLPQAVKDVGEIYKPRWKKCDGNRTKIDDLTYEAAMELYQKADKSITYYIS